MGFQPYINRIDLCYCFLQNDKESISRIETPSAGGFLSYENVADQATVTGLNWRYAKMFVRPTANNGGMNRLTAGLNGSYITRMPK